MKKIITVLLCFALACAAVSAQSDVTIRHNQKGDQAARIGLSLSIPFRPTMAKMGLGGSASLGYDFYLSRNLMIGGEASFVYNTTIGNNVFYYVPLLFNTTWQFDAGKFEFPVTLGIGGALQNYTNSMLFGLDIRPQAGAYYRINSEWSAGANLQVHILPEWFAKQPQYNYVKLFGGIQLGARYHF